MERQNDCHRNERKVRKGKQRPTLRETPLSKNLFKDLEKKRICQSNASGELLLAPADAASGADLHFGATLIHSPRPTVSPATPFVITLLSTTTSTTAMSLSNHLSVNITRYIIRQYSTTTPSVTTHPSTVYIYPSISRFLYSGFFPSLCHYSSMSIIYVIKNREITFYSFHQPHQ